MCIRDSYKIDRKTGEFTRYPISLNGTAGAGTQFVVADLDGDGDLDIATDVYKRQNLGCARPAAEAAVRKARVGGAPPALDTDFEPLFRRALELVR